MRAGAGPICVAFWPHCVWRGALHLLWGGDILFSYAVGALMLLVMLYGNWKYGLAAVIALVVVGVATHTDDLFGLAGMLTFVGVLALYLRRGSVG